MLLSLNEARALQRRADLHLQLGDMTAAIADVKEVLLVRFPSGAREAEEVRLDARARLAQLYLRRGDEQGEQQALREVAEGLSEASGDSFFLAHLESVQAEVYEARARRQSDPAAQREAQQQAVAALTRAIEIDRRLQRSLLNLKEGK